MTVRSMTNLCDPRPFLEVLCEVFVPVLQGGISGLFRTVCDCLCDSSKRPRAQGSEWV